jgi:hypothetical protein
MAGLWLVAIQVDEDTRMSTADFGAAVGEEVLVP